MINKNISEILKNTINLLDEQNPEYYEILVELIGSYLRHDIRSKIINISMRIDIAAKQLKKANLKEVESNLNEIGNLIESFIDETRKFEELIRNENKIDIKLIDDCLRAVRTKLRANYEK